jgi:hypothetical protein
MTGETMKLDLGEAFSTHWSVENAYRMLVGKSENRLEIFALLGCYSA